MRRLFCIVTGLCLLPCACAATNESDGNDASSNGGSTGSAGSNTNGGSTDAGGTPAAGGVASSAGTTSSAGASSLGGSNALGGAGGSGGSGATGLGGSAPTKIDYSIWSLQLPTGSDNSPDSVPPSQLLKGYQDPYFYPAPDRHGQAFMDPATGITTLGSTHCRSELRESTSDGSGVTWDSAQTNVMTVTGKILQLGKGSGGNTTVAQVFNGRDKITLMELQYSGSKGGFALFYEEAKSAGAPPVDLKTSVAIGAEYTFSIALSNGVGTVTINGKPVYSQMVSSGLLGKNFYFKVGNYDQKSIAGTPSVTPFTIVEVSGVDVTHR